MYAMRHALLVLGVLLISALFMGATLTPTAAVINSGSLSLRTSGSGGTLPDLSRGQSAAEHVGALLQRHRDELAALVAKHRAELFLPPLDTFAEMAAAAEAPKPTAAPTPPATAAAAAPTPAARSPPPALGDSLPQLRLLSVDSKNPCPGPSRDVAARVAPPGERSAIFALAAGGSTRELIAPVVEHFLRSRIFVIILLSYDDFDWLVAYPAWREAGVEVIRDKGTKYVMAVRHLPATELARRGATHLWLWDDDMGLTDSFDAASMQALLASTPQIAVAAPHVTEGCHLVCWSDDGYHGVVSTPEMMVAAYSRTAWDCYADLVQPDSPEGWGIDSVYAACLCREAGAALHAPHFGQVMFFEHEVHHRNRKTIANLAGGFKIERAREFSGELERRATATAEGRKCVQESLHVRSVGEGPRDAVRVCFAD